ncbi:glutamate receptor ionotropic, kainate 5 isoform X5 [Bubalus bubalis]|uniref:glutamate receptor ionotropic, kainate 5 isoform X5 n=1 Tax=Bubalus bubalis TaxID=89462 RepID=UPI001E1B7A41|nr:glutamate receptor ionotropic, kainate 5 isoform X5 [Bubalus bubalis]
MVWWRRWPEGWALCPMQRLALISILLAGAPQPDQRAPPPPTPLSPISPSLSVFLSLYLRLPPSLPPARSPPCLPPSLPPLSPHPPALQDPARAAGGQAGGGLGGEKKWRRRRGGRPSWEPGAGGCSSQGTRSPWPGPPAEALRWAPRDTPPSSAFLFHLLLSILPSLLFSISPPLRPGSSAAALLGVSQHPLLPRPRHSSASPRPQHAFPARAEGLRTPGPSLLIQGRPGLQGGGGKGCPPPPPQPALPSPTSPDGRLPCRHPGLAPCGPPRPARLGEGAGALAWAGFPLPRLCLCPLPCVFTFLPPFPLLSPLPSSIFSFPLPPLPARPLLFHLSFLLAPRGAPCLGLVGGHRQRRGRGPCGLPSPPPPQPRRPAPEHLPLVDPILGPRGSPALRPTRIRGKWGPRQLRPHEEGRKMPAELLLLLIVAFASPSRQVLSSLRMAAILDDQTVCGRGERLALALAREQINGIIEVPAKARVEVDIFELQRDSQYETTDTMCQILPKGVVSVLGPSSSPASASTVSHICGEKEIPHIKVGPEETPRLQYLRFASVSLYPSNEDVSLAVSRILKSFNYPSASLICAKAECLLRLEELVRGFLISKETLSVRMLDDSRDPTPLLKEIRDDKVSTIIIDANASISHLILRKASELGMTSAFYKYILTTMDFPILHLDGVVEDSSNILGFSMFNTSHPFYPEFVRSLNMSWRENCEASTYPGPALSAALMFDAVHVVVSAVRELNRSQEIGVKPLACTSANIWPHGTSLMNYLRMVEYDGLTGRVEFNSKGQRTNYTLRILEKSRQGHREIGVWYSNRTLAMNATTLDINLSQTLANKTLVVTTILENPYVMRRPNFQALSGNERFEGFCVDMLRELAELLRFRYRLRLVEDGLYGAPEPNGSWTGMVGELINRALKILVPQPGIEPRAPAVKVWIPNHWTTRELLEPPCSSFFFQTLEAAWANAQKRQTGPWLRACPGQVCGAGTFGHKQSGWP